MLSVNSTRDPTNDQSVIQLIQYSIMFLSVVVIAAVNLNFVSSISSGRGDTNTFSFT